MSTLLVNPLRTTLEQEFSLSISERSQIGSIIPYLYMHNAPSGTFTISIIADYGTAASKSFTSADIKASLDTTDNFAHVFYPVIFDSPTQLDRGTYTLRLSSSGYSFSSSSFLGWIQQHEDLNNQLDYTPSNDGQNPLAFRIKVYKCL